jgi:hypothetical protein
VVVVADASVAIRGDLDKFKQDLKGAEKPIGTLGQRLEKALSFKNVLKTGALFGIGTTLPGMIQRVIGLVGDASQAFQDLERATKSVDAIFGESAGVIEDWANRAAEAAGLSRREVSVAAAGTGQMLQNLGFDAAESADLVVRLQQRAADLAATFGGETSAAVLGIGALLRGEFDTIEKFNVKIKQSDVNARILSLGLDTTTDAAKRNAEAVATLSLFFDQTGGAAGRFGDDMDELSVRMDVTQARIDNAMASLGEGVAFLQLGVIDFVDKTADDWKRAGDVVNAFAITFGHQRVAVAQAAERMGMDIGDLSTRIVREMSEAGVGFDTALGNIEARALAAANYIPGTLTEGGRAAFEAFRRLEHEARDAAHVVLFEPIVEAMLGGKDEAERIAGETPGGIAQALIDNQFSVEDAMAQIAQVAEEALHPLIERASIIAFLSSQAVVNGVNDGTPAVAQAWRDQVAAAEARLAELDGYSWGFQTGTSYARGLNAAYGYVRDAAGNLAAATRGQIGINSEPSDPTSPLHGITRWGGNIAKTLAGGMLAETSTVSDAARVLAGALSPSIGSPGMMGSGAMGGGGDTYLQLVVDGKPKTVGSAGEMWAGFEQLSRFGEPGR